MKNEFETFFFQLYYLRINVQFWKKRSSLECAKIPTQMDDSNRFHWWFHFHSILCLFVDPFRLSLFHFADMSICTYCVLFLFCHECQTHSEFLHATKPTYIFYFNQNKYTISWCYRQYYRILFNMGWKKTLNKKRFCRFCSYEIEI